MESELASNRLSILFLCQKYYYLHKMSRVRFHAIRAIGHICDLIWSGPGWENWDSELSTLENIQSLYRGRKPPDFVLCYKVDEIPGLDVIPYPSGVNRDELQTEDNTAEEAVRKFTQHKIDLVISHQMRQLEHPLLKALPCHFAYIPYCVDTTVFKDYHKSKTIDVLLVGHLAGARYPLRARLYQYLLAMQKDRRFQGYKLCVHPHPGYRLKQAFDDAHVIQYAQLMNASKICLTCSGKYHLKYAKYVEIAACRSLVMADMPGEDQEILKNYLAEIPSNVDYEPFAERLLYYLEHTAEREALIEKGYEIVQQSFTQERYAKDFVRVIREYLAIHGPHKIWNQLP